ncbi:MAG: hypothetical protein ACREKI_04845 [Gemmatimonadota bacterium]
MGIGPRSTLAVLSLLTLVGCGGKKVLMPPRLELAPYQRVGLAVFTIENAKGSLHEYATQRFAEHVLAAQTGFELLELGEQEVLLQEAGATRMDALAVRAIGDHYGVPAIFLGHITVSGVKPRASLLESLSLSAEVDVRMVVRLVSAESGGTLWTQSASATETVAGVTLSGGAPVFASQDPNDAYGELVNHLVYTLTRDLRATWVKQ